jgi:hypothetical protein
MLISAMFNIPYTFFMSIKFFALTIDTISLLLLKQKRVILFRNYYKS